MRIATMEASPVNTHVAVLGGERIECNSETVYNVCDQLVAKYGGTPEVVPLSGTVVSAPPATSELVDGFEVEPELYSVGVHVAHLNDPDYKSARRSQLRHEEKPWAQDVAQQLYNKVIAENRSDSRPIPISRTRMRDTGIIATREAGDIVLNGKSFRNLFGRFPCKNGSAYLEDCPPELRAKNYNFWAVEVGANPSHKDVDVVFRLRDGKCGARTAFAVVSPGYTAFDTHEIARALVDAFPSDAKGSADYNGDRLRFEGIWHADVNVELPNQDDVFKAGVIVRSDDTGAGSIRVQSVMWRARCRNLMIFDEAIGVDVRIRHTGNHKTLVTNFRKAFNEALDSVNSFRVSWVRATELRDRDFINQVQGTTNENLSTLTPEAALPGIFNGILERELVPVRGRTVDIVPKLLHMHSQDEARDAYGVSRASVINAFTRYAHQVESDPFAADAIRLRASTLLSNTKGRAPAPLPYVSFTGR
jgi:hypothetical protein